MSNISAFLIKYENIKKDQNNSNKYFSHDRKVAKENWNYLNCFRLE